MPVTDQERQPADNAPTKTQDETDQSPARGEQPAVAEDVRAVVGRRGYDEAEDETVNEREVH